MEWWVFPALVLCAVTFTAAAGVLVFLAARGVWRLLARYEPTHALAPGGERWVPWEDDPRVGSMILAEESKVHYRGEPEWPQVPIWYGDVKGPGGPPLDWREVAHEEDWRDQTAADLAPATLASGPGGLAWPGPDLGGDWEARSWSEHPGQTDWEVAGSNPAPVAAEPEPVWTVAGRLVETSDEWLRRLVANAAPGWTYAGTVAA